MWATAGAPLLRPQCFCPCLPQRPQSQLTLGVGLIIPGSRFSQLKFRILESPSSWNEHIKVKKRWTPANAICLSGEEARRGGISRIRDWIRKKVEEKQREQVAPGEKVMRMVATATSAPVAQYIAEPVTILHTLDPRVKQGGDAGLALGTGDCAFSSSHQYSFRTGSAAALGFCFQSSSTNMDQLGRVVFLSGLLFVFTALGTDGVPPVVHQRTPPPSLDGLPEVLPSLSGYSYVVMKFGFLQLTRKGLALAAAASCLSFTVLQSATLCLTTTTPEQLAAGLRWFLAPLLQWGAPVDETILTLLLSLRFIGLVFDEVRNIALAVVARGVKWKALKLMETLDTLFTLVGRLFKNLLNHAEKISEAMVARGFKGDASNHRIYFLTQLSLTFVDKLAILALVLLVVVTSCSEILLPA